MEAAKVRIFVSGYCVVIEEETEVRDSAVRPVIPIREAPAEARAWAVRWKGRFCWRVS
jgi:hypothetical protein